ncbi:MAG TPA: Ig-like domain-containing protein [Gemmatimonadaceae bacterium]|nr:Ig-like domain-containing protein [Gemmatimonadaceae bacterium]
MTAAGARALGGALAVAAAVGACAQPAPPPGGPPDPTPPIVVGVTPDSGAVNVRPDEVVFRFDEVISERPSGASTLAQLVLVSPRDGEPEVDWHRDAISVRPRRGWRPNTVYVVQLLPGISDLRNNALDSSTTTVFSTGSAIPDTRIAGVVFDWAEGRPVSAALVQALVLPRGGGASAGDTVRYMVRADSGGRFALPFVPAGPVLVRGVDDRNANFAVDSREAWDTTSVTLRDSARVELYAFVHDTTAPRIATVTVSDSVTLAIALSQPLAVDQSIDTSLVRVYGPDSARVAVAAVLPRAVADSLRALQRDSAARPATDTAPPPAAPPAAPPPSVVPTPGVRPDSARADSLRADSVARARPVPSRPTPVRELVVRLTRPLAPETRYRVELVEARNLLGVSGTSDRTVTTPAPPPPAPPAAPPGTPPPAAPPPTAPPSGRPPGRPPA